VHAEAQPRWRDRLEVVTRREERERALGGTPQPLAALEHVHAAHASARRTVSANGAGSTSNSLGAGRVADDRLGREPLDQRRATPASTASRARSTATTAPARAAAPAASRALACPASGRPRAACRRRTTRPGRDLHLAAGAVKHPRARRAGRRSRRRRRSAACGVRSQAGATITGSRFARW
jgi:hypothetical protein